MKRFAKLLAIMLLSGSFIGIGVFWILYNTAFEQISQQLITTVQSQKAVMSSIAEFMEKNPHGHLKSPHTPLKGELRLVTLSHIEKAHENFTFFGETGEFIIAEKDDEVIKSVFRRRHSTLFKPEPILFDSKLAEPMRLALNGDSGIIIAEDYRGEIVLAAFTPVEKLNLGIVAKLDLNEIREPFINTAIIAVLIALGVYTIGSLIFMKMAAPIEKEIQESEKLYRDLIEGQSELVCRSKKDGTIIFANAAYLTYFDTKLNELIGNNFFDYMPESKKKKVLEEISKLSPTNKTTTHEHQFTVSTDGIRWLQWSNTLLPNQIDGDDEVISVGLDITERKRAEEKQRCSEIHEASLGRIVENSMNEIYVFDTQTLKFEMVNKGAQKNLGYSMEELSNLTALDIKPEFTEQEFRKIIEPLLTGEIDNLRFETVHERKNKTQYNVGVYLSISKEVGHDVFFAVINDITEKMKTDIKLTNALEGIIKTISLVSEARDPYTAGHQSRVSDIAVCIAQEMGIDENRIRGIYWGALIHDIGKIAIPAEILAKPTKLTDQEFKLIKVHPKAGYNVLKDIDFPWPIAEIAYQHHEHIDGTGYPQGLKGDDICLEARIVAVADVVEAITSHRPYRPALGLDVALKEIKDKRGEFYDPEAVDACLKLAKENKLP